MNSAHEISVSRQPAVVAGPTWLWAVKRAALGMAILMVAVTATACLLYASIEQDRAEAGQQIAERPATTASAQGADR